MQTYGKQKADVPHRLGGFGLCLLLIAILSVAAASQTRARDADIPFSTTQMFIEFNATGNDVGVQVLLDGEPWKHVRAFGPDERPILDIKTNRSLQQQGLTELFFESSEPSLDELPLDAFLARFPAGVYEFEGMTVDGIDIEGEAILTHVIPAAPVILSPVSLNEEPPVVHPTNVVIAWESVTQTLQGDPDIDIVTYQVIVEQVEPKRVYSIDLPASVTSVMVPPAFFVQTNTLHKFEVLAKEVSGNQTITEGEFMTAPWGPPVP